MAKYSYRQKINNIKMFLHDTKFILKDRESDLLNSSVWKYNDIIMWLNGIKNEKFELDFIKFINIVKKNKYNGSVLLLLFETPQTFNLIGIKNKNFIKYLLNNYNRHIYKNCINKANKNKLNNKNKINNKNKLNNKNLYNMNKNGNKVKFSNKNKSSKKRYKYNYHLIKQLKMKKKRENN